MVVPVLTSPAPPFGRRAQVGGNTWAGGTGGSDTAGLGGRGGPYRLDKGHTVHQISEAEKAQVSEEARQRAREMAKEALQAKLTEIGMSSRENEAYSRFYEVCAGPSSRANGAWTVPWRVGPSAPLTPASRAARFP